ncbi:MULTISPECIES: bifunctional methylenetetrahydrofolate dehydrogenase/methenyltetrahydrofolate cyclohydrolase FolD [unclassified Oceanispirochaeta]|uniref:bifunctional methylenetetrahydrofolate dehydrogenase/methenyltetrahydrofolate cyclohydrolase FolD n=1 Tax=unclassified Oceanispirochaeta TaxID=2635722 RepID=UPI000E095E4D|nr:bifunctional methylenetetrahydrofolate dehydrogenase/methenyltetrahydrofolate cyclohydrolase FolD [Oceanispirochaeta sp. M1]MBF9015087.1 bifunctional methylenetetrahydrofolate dehydrogenase/methenyltetrahydrofolate cyclohydrolase FolD [Oceanispirochaeta sp. M2]NPD71545.1 bifunctional methylenetetrahydrofolate dehydrogenase/methenyltetrahydrofolate cyclohydrolase FolD [Oceanispirochaeta sp. M1]RDG33223.1 bifunctional methylenetetrahydrofolate dehydrogenase/methenyltetrahydrofolate cyclohydrola
MMATIIDGKAVAQSLRVKLAERVKEMKVSGVVPGLAVVLIGDDPASRSYVTAKEKSCHDLGMYSRDIRLPDDTTEETLLKLIGKLNADDAIDGILVQLPLPSHIDEQKIIVSIDPSKDVDGFHPMNIGRMILEQDTFIPCTPNGILKLLEYSEISTKGKKVVVVGRSNIVGKPITNLMFQKQSWGNATVTVCHTGTKDLKKETLEADILIAAAGRPEMITGDMIKQDAVVIDVGVNRVEDSTKKRGYRLTGDVDFAGASEKASFITPVPGGVGPMTITMLLFNTVKSAEARMA